MSIYNIGIWSNSTTYAMHEVVQYGVLYYYSTQNNNLAQTPDVTSNYWGGVTIFNNGIKPNFIFKPSYGSKVDVTPSIKSIRFGDGYEQRIPDGINNTLLKIDYSFLLRNTYETNAITHFLEKRAGTESFVLTPVAPVNFN